jgi:hypothetical protein
VLVQELLRLGAAYYSDEYAPVDEAGMVDPFAKMLSVRGIIDEYTQTEVPAESLGAVTATEPAPIGLVVMARYDPDAVWSPEILSTGDGIMEMVRNTIPIRENPAMSLRVLNRIVRDAPVLRGNRGEAAESAPQIIEFLENLDH